MKKKLEVILIIMILFLFTGCTGKSNVIVKDDGTVIENIEINEENNRILYGNYDVNDSLDLYLKKYLTALKVSKYSFNKYSGKNISGIKIEKKYDNICDYANKTIFSQYLYKTIKCSENDIYYELYNEGAVVQNEFDDYKEMPDVRTLYIKLPVSATEQNADEVDGNTYIWKYDENTKDKNFYLKISKSALEESKKNYIKNQEIKKNRSKIINIGIIVGVILLIACVIFVFYKKYKKNNFDYE